MKSLLFYFFRPCRDDHANNRFIREFPGWRSKNQWRALTLLKAKSILAPKTFSKKFMWLRRNQNDNSSTSCTQFKRIDSLSLHLIYAVDLCRELKLLQESLFWGGADPWWWRCQSKVSASLLQRFSRWQMAFVLDSVNKWRMVMTRQRAGWDTKSKPNDFSQNEILFMIWEAKERAIVNNLGLHAYPLRTINLTFRLMETFKSPNEPWKEYSFNTTNI